MTNVFVLCTGRCGSVTFIEASRHITNYTAGHETRTRLVGPQRTEYPARHIEADNRLSWLLGRLELAYGRDAKYVHLVRDPDAVARSFASRWGQGIIHAYDQGLLLGAKAGRHAVCRDYVETVTTNIKAFLADKPHRMLFRVENAAADWAAFWEWIGAEGDYKASAAEWAVLHNATVPRRLFAMR